jgi:RNase adaptor protein for sRNA GlmZ degradation
LHSVELPIALPTLLAAFQAMLGSPTLLQLSEAEPEIGQGGPVQACPLTVRILSFSFHSPVQPKDSSGNGGGFVFDARGIPNPAREERYKPLTGKDQPVIEYLEQQESARKFLANVSSLVDASVANYQQRGFKHLMVSFGCTGGRHRSVYMAEQLARHLRNKNGVEVAVQHLELERLSK